MIGPKYPLGTFCLTNKGSLSQSFDMREISSNFGIKLKEKQLWKEGEIIGKKYYKGEFRSSLL